MREQLLNTLEQRMDKYISGGNINVYKVLIYNYPALRVKLDSDFKIELRNFIFKKYKSFLGFAREEGFVVIENLAYTIVRNWFRERNCSAIPIDSLRKISSLLGISEEEMLNHIEEFSLHAGKSIILPQYVQIDTDLLYAIGLYLAEGKNDTRWRFRTAISNTDFDICKFAIYWFEKYFGIKKNRLKFYTNIPKMTDREQESLRIANTLSIEKSQIFVYNSELCRTTDIAVSFDSKPLRFLVDWMKENLIILAITNREFGISFAQGVLDGEGHIRYNSPEILLEMKNDLVLNAVELIYRNLGMFPNIEKYGQVIQISARDFDKLAIKGAFRFCKKRKNKFDEQYLTIKHKQVRRGYALMEILSLITSYDDFVSLSQLVKNSKYANKNSVNHTICSAVKNNYVSKIGRGKENSPFQYKITEAGISYINSLSELDSQRCERLEHSICQQLSERWA